MANESGRPIQGDDVIQAKDIADRHGKAAEERFRGRYVGPERIVDPRLREQAELKVDDGIDCSCTRRLCGLGMDHRGINRLLGKISWQIRDETGGAGQRQDGFGPTDHHRTETSPAGTTLESARAAPISDGAPHRATAAHTTSQTDESGLQFYCAVNSHMLAALPTWATA